MHNKTEARKIAEKAVKKYNERPAKNHATMDRYGIFCFISDKYAYPMWVEATEAGSYPQVEEEIWSMVDAGMVNPKVEN